MKLEDFSDWYQVSKREITNRGGRSLLQYYKNSYHRALISIYPNFQWRFNAFPSHFSHSQRRLRDILRVTMDSVQETNGVSIHTNFIHDHIRFPYSKRAMETDFLHTCVAISF